MHIAIITAGGAGMFCGSCMHDNTWARALIDAGCDVSLIPTYTPIRVDEEDRSDSHVFLGGLNVYLDAQFSAWNRLPRALTRWLDTPWLINFASRLSARNDARKLGDLALAMLSGEAGPQRREIAELAQFIARDLQPDLVIFSNALLSGALRTLREQYAGPVLCTLQGDDVFLDALPESHKSRVIAAVSERAREFDGFLVHSRFYREYISRYLSLPEEKFHELPLGIDFSGHHGTPRTADAESFTVGYFARIAPEKGLHHLIEGFRLLHAKHPQVRLRVGGYLGRPERGYYKTIKRAAQSLGDAFTYVGSPRTLADKVRFLQSLDVLSVPTEFLEPKGLYVLEAMANGVPVVQPRHGAFPELIEATGGGLLVEPKNPQALADALEQLLLDTDQRAALGVAGHGGVRERYTTRMMADATLAIASQYTARHSGD